MAKCDTWVAYAAVIAETEQQARDAAEKINADIKELPAVIDMASALSGKNFVHDEIGTNQCYDWGGSRIIERQLIKP